MKKIRSTSANAINRRSFVTKSVLGAAATLAYPGLSPAHAETALPSIPEVKAFELDEVTIDMLQTDMRAGKYTSRAIVEKYLQHIEDIDKSGPALNSVIELNPDALEIAEALDRERKEKGPRGPLHGIPVLIKDNIDTADQMMTTAGSLALVERLGRRRTPSSRRNCARREL